MIAQSVAEYGLLAQAATAMQSASNAVGLWIREAGPWTWVVFGAVVMGVLWSLKRRGTPP